MRAFDWFRGDRGNYRLHNIGIAFWTANIPVALLTDLKTSIAYVVFCSIYANLVGHWSGSQAARASLAIEASETRG